MSRGIMSWIRLSGCADVWATRRLSERRLGDKLRRLGDNIILTFVQQNVYVCATVGRLTEKCWTVERQLNCSLAEQTE